MEVHQQLQDSKYSISDVTNVDRDDDVEDNSIGISLADGDHTVVNTETTEKEHDSDSVTTN
jgi:hypothetical protein